MLSWGKDKNKGSTDIVEPKYQISAARKNIDIILMVINADTRRLQDMRAHLTARKFTSTVVVSDIYNMAEDVQKIDDDIQGLESMKQLFLDTLREKREELVLVMSFSKSEIYTLINAIRFYIDHINKDSTNFLEHLVLDNLERLDIKKVIEDYMQGQFKIFDMLLFIKELSLAIGESAIPQYYEVPEVQKEDE
jgi:hypothetical protein